MGLIGTVKSLPILVLVALVCLLVANLLNGIAFCTTSWGETFTYILNSDVIDPTQTITNFGLWRICSGTPQGYILGSLGSCGDTVTGTAQDWLAAVQALVVFGFAGILGSFILMSAYLLGKKNDDYILLAAIICIITGVLYLIGIIIYGAKFNEPVIVHPAGRRLSWSFGLAVVSIILELVSGVLLLLGRKNSGTSPA